MSEPVLAMIVAMADNRVIGRDNQLPWHLPDDLQYFKRVTMGKPIIMGRKTYESIGRPLPGRLNIVVSRQADFRPEGVEVVVGLDAAVARGLEAARESGADEVMIIGGAQLYEHLMPQVERLYLTEVHIQADGDARFPELDAQWRETSREDGCSEKGLSFSFVRLERVASR